MNVKWLFGDDEVKLSNVLEFFFFFVLVGVVSGALAAFTAFFHTILTGDINELGGLFTSYLAAYTTCLVVLRIVIWWRLRR